MEREMFDVKDPAIKLFGKTIPFPETQMPLDSQHKDSCRETTTNSSEEDHSCALNNGKEDSGQTLNEENKAMVDDTKLEKEQITTDCAGQDKVLKKPDKILPCPRCNSLDTKFCYYNNYNVNQPRHFCKNCQRYWTAGGTMRNVPVGAGRRKNKHIASQYRHILMSSDGIPTTQVDSPDAANSCDGISAPLRSCTGNGTILKFGQDAPLCESMTSVLNLGDQKKKVEMGAEACGGNGEEPSSCGSSVSASTYTENELPGNVAQMEQRGMQGCCNGPTPPSNPLQCYPGPHWVYPWNTSWSGIAAMPASRCSSELFYRLDNDNPNQVQWGATSMVVPPNFCTPNMPFPFLPPSYWGCMSNSWDAGALNMAWNGSNGTQSPSSSTSKSGCSTNGSATLGKHSRDANIDGEVKDKPEKCLWVPKTLRIDDPDEAAKSSIWATLGIKPGQNEPIQKGGIFKAFQPKTEDSSHASDATQVLRANPAALSRSQTFQEST